MTHTTLPCIYRPLRGWCDAVFPLLRTAWEVLPGAVNGGRRMTGASRRRVAALAVWEETAGELGLKLAAFQAACESWRGQRTRAHISATRQAGKRTSPSPAEDFKTRL